MKRVLSHCQRQPLARLLCLIILSVAAGDMRAAEKIWDGGGADGKWQTGANWLDNTPPVAGDVLIFTNTVRLASTNDFAAGTLFNGINFNSPAGAFTLRGNSINLGGGITNNQEVTVETILLPLSLSSTPTIEISSNASLTISNVVSGSGQGVTKVGGGTLTLTATNTFTGPLTIGGGYVNVSSDVNLGAVPGSFNASNIVLQSGGILRATTGFTINTNRGILVGPSGSGRTDVDSGQTLVYRGSIANNGAAGGLTKGGPGGLTLSGTNTYTGPTLNRVGTLTLDFTQTNAPLSNIVSSSSTFTIGGENAGIGTVNAIQLIANGRAGATNSQTFGGTAFDIGHSLIRATNGLGGQMNLALGALNPLPGGAVTFVTPGIGGGSGRIGTSSTNLNGILGSWATISQGAQTVNGIIVGTNWASVDGAGNIYPYTNFTTYSSGTIASQVGAQSNLIFSTSPGGQGTSIAVDMDEAGSTIDLNTLTINVEPNFGINIGSNNTLRLGKYGGIFLAPVVATANSNYELGNGTESTGNNQGVNAVQNIGTLTAGGSTYNTPGTLVFTINSSIQTGNGSVYVENAITDNGPSGKVTVIKTGPGPMKFRGHNSFSGNMYILQGRIQMAGSELTNSIFGPGTANTANPDAFGTGDIYVLPGGQAFPSGSGGNTNAGLTAITNNWFIAGNGVSDNVGAIRMNGVFSNGIITLIGDARLGGGGPGASVTGNPVPMYDKITGSFGLDFGATGNPGGTAPFNCGCRLFNTANDWSGNTTIVGQTGGTARGTILKNGASDVIPDGFGKGNMQFGNTGNTVSLTWWDLSGFNETINALISVAGTAIANQVVTNTTGTPSILTLGNNDQSGTWGGSIGDAGSGGTISVIKIGGGTETFNGPNTYSGDTTINAGSFALSGSGSIANSANIIANTGGSLDMSGVSGGFTTTKAVKLNGGTMIGNTAASGIGTLAMTNAALTLTVNPTVMNVTVSGASGLSMGGLTNRINIIAVTGISSYPTQFTVVKYSGTLQGTFNMGFGSVPSLSTIGYFSNDTANAQVVLVLTDGPKPLTWRGNLSSSWDINTTLNWLAFGTTPAPFNDADSILFDDSASNSAVNITTIVSPSSITISNQGLTYNLTGSGYIAGFGGLVKNGAGSVTFANTGSSDFKGGVTVNGGSVTFATDNAISGGITLASGSSIQVGTNGGTGTLPTGIVNSDGDLVFNRGADLAAANVIGGNGTITKNDAAVLTLSGANTYTGAVTVAGGTLKAGSGTALGVTNGTTTVNSGATLDVGGQNLGGERITVSGSGVGGNGAIINSGADQINALQSVTLVGNTTFGGTGRWDIRGGLATLSTGGNAYNISKVGSNQVSLVGVTNVDEALADINVLQGTFGVETTTAPTVGNSNNTVTVSSGATLHLHGLTAAFNKKIVLNGDGTTTTLNGNSGAQIISNQLVTLNGATIVNVNTAGTTPSLAIASTIGGTGSLTKSGTAPLYLTGIQTYSGSTTVTNGTLYMNGTKEGAGSVTVLPGATLAGIGSVGGSVTITANSILSPGDPSVFVHGTLSVNALTLNGCTNIFELGSTTNVGGAFNDLVNVTNGLTATGVNQLHIFPTSFMEENAIYTLFQYGGAFSGSAANFQIINPLGYQFSLVNPASTPGKIQIKVDLALGNDFWQGGFPGSETIWNNGITTNWIKNGSPSVFTNFDFANFTDSAVTDTVTLVGALQPTQVNFSNNAVNYTWTGTGKLSGTNSVYVEGSGKVIIANSGTNDYTGKTVIDAGTLQVGNGGTAGDLGRGPISNNAVLVFNRSDAFTVTNVMSGTANSFLIKSNTAGVLTLSGANTFGTFVTVQEGTLRTLNSLALGNTNGETTIAAGATLDIGTNTVNMIGEVIRVAGAGVGGKGAIVNNSGSAAFANENIGRVTMTGDTVIGGTGRLDLRPNNTTATPTVYLSTEGNAYKLTKVGTNQISLVSVIVDDELGDIEVLEGTLGIEKRITTLGNIGNTLTISNNATLHFFQVSNTLYKPVVMKDGAMIDNSSGSNTFGGPITLMGSNRFNAGGASLTLTNVIDGTGIFSKLSGAIVVLQAANTYSGATYVNGGTLILTNDGSINNSPLISLASGTTLNVQGRTDSKLTLSGTQTLQGSGTVRGSVEANSGSMITPGISGIGTLTITNGDLTLGGTVAMDINGTSTRDLIQGMTNLTYGGTLRVTNINPNAPFKVGQSFKLFSAQNYAGTFASIIPSQPGGHLFWRTNELAVDGTLKIAGVLVTNITLNPGEAVLSGIGFQPGATYHVLSTTNLTNAVALWTVIKTNTFDGNGNFVVTNTITPEFQRYFMIQTQYP